MTRARGFWLACHLWLGLTLGGLLVILGLTGSVLVFYTELDRLLNPHTVASAPAPDVDVDAAFAALRAAHPERSGAWRIELPLHEGVPLMARYYRPAERAERSFAPLLVTLDPATLAITRTAFWGDTVVTWIYDLHYTLLLDRPGKTAVGIAGLLMLLSLGSGLWLWWPRHRSVHRLLHALKPVLRHGRARLTYDLHVLSGSWGAVLLITLALTGAALALPDQTRSLITPVSPLFRMPDLGAIMAPTDHAITAADAVAVACARFPGGEPRWVESPSLEGGVWRVVLHQPDEPSRRFPRTQVWVHPETGAIIAERDATHDSGGDTILNWLHPLHNGEAFGMTGRVLVCIAGLLPAILFVTGWVRWRQKARAKALAGQRRPGTRQS